MNFLILPCLVKHWVHGTANSAYFADNNINTPLKSNLQGVTDFHMLFDGIQPALTRTFRLAGWSDEIVSNS